MSELLFRLASKANPLFKFGIPHRPERLIPLTFSSHFCMFDAAQVGPLFAMLQINCTNADKLVERDDDFVADHTLPKALRTTNGDYKRWNEANPNNPMDRGHLLGSQMRRGNPQLQHDIDSLSSVIPETPALNRKVKNPLECAIVERCAQDDVLNCRYIAGPALSQDVLGNGQVIPSYSWITIALETHSKVLVYAWIMKNEQDLSAVNLRESSQDNLESYTGLRFWSELPELDRKKTHDDDWWLAGQPTID